jgi:hypothetical protein
MARPQGSLLAAVLPLYPEKGVLGCFRGALSRLAGRLFLTSALDLCGQALDPGEISRYLGPSSTENAIRKRPQRGNVGAF